MSDLPEWLWPAEDEEAIQEAERLIEDTHEVLRRMETDMGIRRSSGKSILEEAEKLKTAFNNKMQILEKELILKEVSKPTFSSTLPKKSNSLHREYQTKTSSIGKNNQQEAESSHVGHPCMHQQSRMTNSNSAAEDAEKVVLTARAKVQDALAVARNVSASLQQRVSASASLHNKPLMHSHPNNVGTFEVKSKIEEKKEKASKVRLQLASLPSISIRHCLERQSIPSFQVPPGKKFQPVNVSVGNFVHKDEASALDGGEKEMPSVQEHPNPASSPSQNGNTKLAVIQLSKQLAQVEELREINQTQVNQVLRFLLSRVCPPSQSSERPTSCEQADDKDAGGGSKASSPLSNTHSSSENSKCSIAYDSLSRFLETYKQAAEHCMSVKKRASVRRQKIALKQKKEIEQVGNSTRNHLLIGPLRQTARSVEKELTGSVADLQDLFKCSISNSSHGQGSVAGSQVNFSQSILKDGWQDENTIASKADINLDTVEENRDSNISDSLELLLSKDLGAISGEDYEDDWEEEEIVDGTQRPDKEEINPLEPMLQTIKEVEEHYLSSPHQTINNISLNHPTLESLQEHEKPLNTSSPQNSIFEAAMPNEEGFRTLVLQDKLESCKDGLLAQSAKSDTNIVPVQLSAKNGTTNCLENLLPSRDVGIVSSLAQKSLIESEENLVSNCEQQRNFEVPSARASNNDIGFKSVAVGTSPRRRTKGKHLSTHMRNRESNRSPCSSSSDVESKVGSRQSLHNPRRWDLSLRKDLQLQSAMLLNWQLEDRWKTNTNGGQPSQGEAVEELEKRWRTTLEQLDQRLKTIEDHDKMHNVVKEIINLAREDPSKNANVVSEIKAVEGSGHRAREGPQNNAVKVLTREQTVQTLAVEETIPSFPAKELEQQVPIRSTRGQHPNSGTFHEQLLHGVEIGRLRPSPFCNDDLTSELLTYSRMGMIPKLRFPEPLHSKSVSSSTTSSQIQQSSTMVSFSDGEMRASWSSCSCSEGELCMCGGQKDSSARAPPDGSHTVSDGENVLLDVSQGEILPRKDAIWLKDMSFGELVNNHPLTGESSPSGIDFAEEESFESDAIEWELKYSS